MGTVYHKVKEKERARKISAPFLRQLLLFLGFHQSDVQLVQLRLGDFPKWRKPFGEP